MHDIDDALGAKVPDEQAEQSAEPEKLLKNPALQATHTDAPSELIVPIA